MRPPRLTLIASLAFLLVASGASVANAASLTFSGFFQEHEHDSTGADVDSLYFNSPLSTTDVVTGLSNSISFTDSTVNASFDVAMTGVGSFTSSLVLGSSIALSGTFNNSGDDYAIVEGNSHMIFEDRLNLSGGAGRMGTLRLAFDVDGTLAGAGSAIIIAINATHRNLDFGRQELTSGQQQVTMDVGFWWDLNWHLGILLSTHVDFELYPPNGHTSGAGSALFANTARLTSVSVLDENGQLVPSARILSDADLIYPSRDPATPVPEPSSLSIMALGIAALAAARRTTQALVRRRCTLADRCLGRVVAPLEWMADTTLPGQAADRCRLAPPQLPPVLDVEEPTAHRPTDRTGGRPRVNSYDVSRESALGCAAHSRRVAKTRDRRESIHGRQIYAPWQTATLADVEDGPREPPRPK